MGLNVSAEKDFPCLTGKYFGQKEPGDRAELFSPGLISLKEKYEFALSFHLKEMNSCSPLGSPKNRFVSIIQNKKPVFG